MLTIADKGRRGRKDPPNIADIIGEQSLNGMHLAEVSEYNVSCVNNLTTIKIKHTGDTEYLEQCD